MTNPRGTHKWQFAPRFRRHTFGWRSDTPIQRIKEALSEIKQVARTDPLLAAEGAVTFLMKLSPALEQVDSSSGALGSAVNRAIATLVPIIAQAGAEPHIHEHWLERLWQALQDDQMPYIENLGEYWGELCVSRALASRWADRFLPDLALAWQKDTPVYVFFKGTTPCLAALYTAARFDELLAMLERAPVVSWYYREWGVKALVAMGRKAEALRYAKESRGLNNPDGLIAEACEAILLSSGMAEEAYRNYALEANSASTHLATYRAIVKKYPKMSREQILRDLIASTPGAEGKWFAAAKDAGHYRLAIELVTMSPTDPRTLTRAARDFAEREPAFAVAAGLAALRWIAEGHGYDITSTDVQDAYAAIMQAASQPGANPEPIKAEIMALFSVAAGGKFIKQALAQHLTG